MTSIVWFRLDLRLADQPALAAAVRTGGSVVPVFIYAPEEETPWEPGAASRWWLHQTLMALDLSLRRLGSRLILRRGPSLENLRRVVKEAGAGAVYWNHRYEPAVVTRDEKLKVALGADGLEVQTFNAALLHEPSSIKNRSGKPFQVFTPFWRHCLGQPGPAAPLSAPSKLRSPREWPASLTLSDLELEPKIDWAQGLRAAWQPGEIGARKQLKAFLARGLAAYAENRDRPDMRGTSRLSPHLHFGEIGPRQVWHAIHRVASPEARAAGLWRNSRFLAELGWREFAYHLFHHFPHTADTPLRAEFNTFPWRNNHAWLTTWQKGQTGYPIVDAGMRELWTTGWMHNRVRMIVASFLVKDLMISWRDGARWFWDTLVDADLANNTLGWQWTAGCGADAAPFFRVFNPLSQGDKFDPSGAYVRRWCPELARLPDGWIHQPHKAPPELVPGLQYPRPIVTHAIAREVALEAFAATRTAAH